MSGGAAMAGTRWARRLAYAVLLAWAAVCAFPLYWLAITSIKRQADIDQGPRYLPFVDFAPSLDSWRFILGDPSENLVSRFFNSLAIGLVATALALTTAALALYGLTRLRPSLRWPSFIAWTLAGGFALLAALVQAPPLAIGLLAAASAAALIAVVARNRGRAVEGFGAIAFMLASRALPPAVIAVPVYIMFQTAGLLDTRISLVVVYAAVNLPVALWLLQPVMGWRATEQEEAAQLEGASHPAILFTILLPMLRGGIAAAGLIVFLLCWNEYLFAATLSFDHALTLPPWMVGQLSMKEAQAGGETEELAHLSAAAVLMAVPALVLAGFVHRFLARSLVRHR